MCGIAGIISNQPAHNTQQQLQRMANALEHRGPDGEGFWQNEQHTIGFAHRRLSIIDLSHAADQPMHYLHYSLVFNGEIYNYKELKSSLQSKGYVFYSTGDTELIPAAYDCWGIDFLHRLDGMFVFALYDNKKNQLLLARDRFGEKPFYHTTLEEDRLGETDSPNKVWLFASEMKALWAAGVPKQVNNGMLLNYITIGYVQNPINPAETFYQNIFSLPAGHFILTGPNNIAAKPQCWYQPGEQIAAAGKFTGSEKEAVQKFQDLLLTSVSRRLRSDVPVGTSLSGGLDSSAVVAMIKRSEELHNSPKGVGLMAAFTAIFPGFEKDESEWSKQVAGHFGIQQYCVEPGAGDWVANWQQLLHYQEEPMQSSSVLTQYMVYELAKKHGVTVLLDGQGADELLGGYKKYSQWYLQQLYRSDAALFKKEKALLAENGFLENWSMQNAMASWLPVTTAKMLSKKAYKQQTGHPHISHDFFLHNFDKASLEKPVVRSLEDMLYYNSFQFGLQELLRYADRNSMAHSREVRLPFLFHELVEFIFSLPPHFKIRDGFTKWILRKSVEGLLPPAISWRKGKIGYEPPQQSWMEQPAIIEMMMESRKILVTEGILKPELLNEKLLPKGAHEANNFDWRYTCAAGILK